MKSLLVIIFALVVATFASDESNAREVLECFRQALDGGIEDANLTNFNPLRPEDQITVADNFLISGTINITNTVIEGLVDFNITELIAERGSSPDNVNFIYNLTWPEIRITADYAQNVSILGRPHVILRALINITYIEAHMSGIFNITIGSDPHLDDFYFEPSAEHVVDTSEIIEGRHIAIDEEPLSVHDMLIQSDLSDYLSPIIMDYLNKEWIVGGRDRLKIVFEDCKQ